MKMKAQHAMNKRAKVGDVCVCPSCGSTFTKLTYQQVFCKTKPGTQCKDKYWNTVIPEKRNNRTRISPASAAYMEQHREHMAHTLGFPSVEAMENDYDDPSWDAHGGVELEICKYCGLRSDFCRCGEGASEAIY